MRIIAGRFKGRRLTSFAGSSTRPTSDRVRENLFNILGDLSDARVLDLFAGTGAVGLEALSRGAKTVQFVERSGRAAATLKKNVALLNASPFVSIWRRPVDAALEQLVREDARFDLIFADPPYEQASTLLKPVFTSSAALLADAGTLVVEHPAGAYETPETIEQTDRRRYGDSFLSFFQRC